MSQRNLISRRMRSEAERAYRVALGHLHRAFLSPWNFFKVFCFSIGLGVLLTMVALTFVCISFFRSLPDLDRLDLVQLKGIANKKILARLEDKHAVHRWVPLAEFSRDYIYSIVMSEDATFFEHNGFNIDAIADSLAENIKERKASYGGSTISQQVVKNLFLSSEKTVTRKLKEFFLTRRMEGHFTKNEIIEVYLNMAEFGPDIFGADAAARRYFGKRPSDINAAEGVFIAQMLPSPRKNYFTIFQNRNLTKARRRRIARVLRTMLYEELVTEKQFAQYVRYDYFKATPSRIPTSRK